MLALTFTTGIVDAVGYLGLDRVFTANMTGNVVILGMALAGADDLPVLGPALALVGFLAGAALGGRVLRTAPAGWSDRTSGTFAATGVLAVGLGIGALVAPPVEATTWALVVTTLLAVAMGLQAATARRLAVKDVTTVVVTSTLTGLAADSRLAGGTGDGWARRSLAVGADPGRRRGGRAAAARRRGAWGRASGCWSRGCWRWWRRSWGTRTARPDRSRTGVPPSRGGDGAVLHDGHAVAARRSARPRRASRRRRARPGSCARGCARRPRAPRRVRTRRGARARPTVRTPGRARRPGPVPW